MTLRLYDVENNILYSDLDLNIYLPDVHQDSEAWYEDNKVMLQKPTATQGSIFKEKILDDDKLDVTTAEGKILRSQSLAQVANYIRATYFAKDKTFTTKYLKQRIKDFNKLVIVNVKQGKDPKCLAYWGDIDESKYVNPKVVTWEVSDVDVEKYAYSQAHERDAWWKNYYGGSY
jgi:hypothetical protein